MEKSLLAFVQLRGSYPGILLATGKEPLARPLGGGLTGKKYSSGDAHRGRNGCFFLAGFVPKKSLPKIGVFGTLLGSKTGASRQH